MSFHTHTPKMRVMVLIMHTSSFMQLSSHRAKGRTFLLQKIADSTHASPIFVKKKRISHRMTEKRLSVLMKIVNVYAWDTLASPFEASCIFHLTVSNILWVLENCPWKLKLGSVISFALALYQYYSGTDVIVWGCITSTLITGWSLPCLLV